MIRPLDIITAPNVGIKPITGIPGMK